MLWLIFTASGVGLLFGLSLVRVHLIAMASAVLTILCAAAAPFAHWTLLATLGGMLASVGALQFGYLAGLGLALVWSRTREADEAGSETGPPAPVGSLDSNVRSHV